MRSVQRGEAQFKVESEFRRVFDELNNLNKDQFSSLVSYGFVINEC